MKPEMAKAIERLTGGRIKFDYEPPFSPSAEEIVSFMGEGWTVPHPESVLAIENARAGNRVILYKEPDSDGGYLTLTISSERANLELSRPYSFPGERDLRSINFMTINNITHINLYDWGPNDRRLAFQSRDASLAIDQSLRLHVQTLQSRSEPRREAASLIFDLLPLLRREIAKSDDAWKPSPR